MLKPLPIVLAIVGLGLSWTAADPGDYWDRQRRGANLFNRHETARRLTAARALGLDFVRIAPDKWSAARRDFLIGNADGYQGIPAADRAELRRVLNEADRAGIKVVLTMLSLPGARWRQNNDSRDDGRLWQERDFQTDAIRFWKELAAGIGRHPAVVGYDLLNEPHPARTLAGLEDVASPEYARWWRSARGTPADLNRFYRRIVAAIREVDRSTPILLESSAYADAAAMGLLEPLDDPHVLYSFHFYEPWSYTTRRVNKGRYAYPDRMPRGWNAGTERWPRNRIPGMFDPVARWAAANGVPANRIVLGEFGCSRRVEGVAAYLSDVIDAANARGWHWAFYSFREDTWSDMDYELGTAVLPWRVTEQIQSGARSRDGLSGNPLFSMLRRKIQAPLTSGGRKEGSPPDIR